MENKDQPAFPDTRRAAEQSYSNQNPEQWPTGLTKREYFAGLAMQGLLSRSNPDGMTVQEIAAAVEDSVKIADFLLYELSKTQP